MVLMALLFALAIVLSIVESSFPSLLVTIPGIKFGLSNIAVMYALFFLKKPQALMIALLKGAFVASTRGLIAGLLSVSGGLLSLGVMILLMFLFREKISYLIISIAGAVFHNIGQLIAIAFIYTSIYTLAYFPVLLIAGVAAGIATAALLRFIIPALKRIG